MPMRAEVVRGFLVAPLLVVSLSLVGCGPPDRPKTIPISGKVTIDGHEPGEFGKLFFTPTEPAPGYDRRPARGSFDQTGVYRVMSWTPDDGLVPGHYTVNIQPADMKTTKIPVKYHNSATSGVEVDVPVDQSKIDFSVDILTK